jgi:hypothetical protein
MTAERIESVLFAWVLKKRRLASFSSSLMDSEWEIVRELIPRIPAWPGVAGRDSRRHLLPHPKRHPMADDPGAVPGLYPKQISLDPAFPLAVFRSFELLSSFHSKQLP